MLLGNDDGSSPLGQPGSSSEMLLLLYYPQKYMKQKDQEIQIHTLQQ